MITLMYLDDISKNDGECERTKCISYLYDIGACEASGVWIFRRAYDILITRLTHAW